MTIEFPIPDKGIDWIFKTVGYSVGMARFHIPLPAIIQSIEGKRHCE